MSRNNRYAEVKSQKEKVKNEERDSPLYFYFCLFTFAFLSGCGVRFDMQDQPRYKAYKKSDFFSDHRGSRDPVEGTVARGQLHENKAFYTGKIDNPNLNAPVATTTDASGNTLVASFPNDIDEFPVPVTKELVDRGQERFNIYCIVCHGPVGNADGMIVRRGFPKPPTYHDDRLAKCAGRTFLRCDDQRLGQDEQLCLSGPAGGPLGDHRVYPGVAGKPESGRKSENEFKSRVKYGTSETG